jgi:hypothetical protein
MGLKSYLTVSLLSSEKYNDLRVSDNYSITHFNYPVR